jgi:signal transduction histidine kinase
MAASSSQDPIALIAQATAADVGTEFLAGLVRSMHVAMDTSIAFITRGIGDPPQRARAIFSWKKSGAAFPDEYDLEGTACRMVYGGELMLIPRQLWQAFPREAGYEGYCGIPLRNNAKRVVGHFAVVSQAPMVDSERVRSIMRIFGLRAEAELQRLERETEREVLIGRLKHAIASLTQQHQATRRANAFKSEALGMVVHDLRNPLSVIFGRVEFVEALLEQQRAGEPLNEQLQKASHAIGRSAERMQRMLADLLASARSDATAITLDRAGIDLAMPVRVAIGLCHATAEAKRIRIVEDVQDVGPADADETRVIEALENLLGNAIKFSEAGTTVTISVRRHAKAALAEIGVADEGPGLDDQDLARAFQRYQTLSAKPTGGETSIGLGLAIVKAIADAHGGSVEAASAGKGKGSTFFLRLPLAAGAARKA